MFYETFYALGPKKVYSKALMSYLGFWLFRRVVLYTMSQKTRPLQLIRHCQLEPRRRAATPGPGESVSDMGACGVVGGAESAHAM